MLFDPKSSAENKVQQNCCKSIKKNFSGIFVEDVKTRKRMLTAKTAEEKIKIQSMKTYDEYERKEVEDGKDPFTIYYLKKNFKWHRVSQYRQSPQILNYRSHFFEKKLFYKFWTHFGENNL